MDHEKVVRGPEWVQVAHETTIKFALPISPLHIATIPKHQVAGSKEGTWAVVARLVADPALAVTDEDLRGLAEQTDPGPLIGGALTRIRQAETPGALAHLAVQGLMSSSSTVPFSVPSWRFSEAPSRRAMPIAEAVRLFQQPDAAAITAFDSASQFQIPFGLSPQTDSATFARLLDESRWIALLPLSDGVFQSVEQIHHHQWLVAIETTATTGAVVLMFVGTVSLVSWLVRRLG